ncbi:hypothetical protein [Bradyrhizobium sp. 6(2017)]|uniref:hypothetical protein n=1 Tax=Bradyrhizobium sp. 6(2017) TaxID=1197460 RepID=UPI001FEE51F9|nr:hypothetical protein [Bradyrhizobium sp. 6(2017)]
MVGDIRNSLAGRGEGAEIGNAGEHGHAGQSVHDYKPMVISLRIKAPLIGRSICIYYHE